MSWLDDLVMKARAAMVPAPPATPGMSGTDITDPASPEYSRRHGGQFATDWLTHDITRPVTQIVQPNLQGPPPGDMLDPQSPAYAYRHGGPTATGIVGSTVSGLTAPGDAAQGKIPADQMLNRALDTAGLLTFGPAGDVPAGAFTAGGVGRSNSGAKFPQYAERYPPVPEPVTMVNEKGREYLARGSSPETKAFMKERAAIRKSMQDEGYQPYFDPAQRADVDPKNYPTATDTLTDRPKKAVTVEKYEGKAFDPAALQRLREAYETGAKLPNAANWYHVRQLEDEFVKELGPEAGRKAFQEKFARAMAATTGGSNPEENFLNAMFSNYQRKHGEPIPSNAYAAPSPTGGRYQGSNLDEYSKRFPEGGEPLPYDTLNPKRHNFEHNFLGHADKATIDEQMMQLWSPGTQKPETGAYGVYQAALNKLAAEYKVDPRYFQEVAWAGGKRIGEMTGKKPKTAEQAYSGAPMIQTINESIERTSRLTGLSPQEVVRRGIVRSEIPLYAGGLPIGWAQQQPQQQAPPAQPRLTPEELYQLTGSRTGAI